MTDSALEQMVRQRAGNRCEYCRFPECYAEIPFQIDHIVARQHGGSSCADNLALACGFCNRFKGPNLSGVDPVSRAVVRLFNPRQERWTDHFFIVDARLIGKTATGRATIQTLNVN